MNATIIIAATSMVFAIAAVCFYLLSQASEDGRAVWGTLKTSLLSDTGDSMTFSFAKEGNVETVVFEDPDGLKGMIKKIDAPEITDEPIYLGYEWSADGTAYNCRDNVARDKDRFESLSVAELTDMGTTTFEVSEEGYEGDAVTVPVEITINQGAPPADLFPEVDWTKCAEIGEKLTDDMFEEGDSPDDRMMRMLGTTQAQMAQDVYEDSNCNAQEDTSYASFEGTTCAMWDQDKCTISFRGSDDNGDWAANILGTVASFFDGSSGVVNGEPMHNGFKSLFDQFKSKNGNEAKLKAVVDHCGDNTVFVGHSLGGGLAMVARQYFGKGKINTYAAPTAFQGGDREIIRVGVRTFHESDPVPKIPGAGFTHGHKSNQRLIVTDCHSQRFTAGFHDKCTTHWWFECGWRGCRRKDRTTCVPVPWFDYKCGSWHTSVRTGSGNTGGSYAPHVGVVAVLSDIFMNAISLISGTSHFHSMTTWYLPNAAQDV